MNSYPPELLAQLAPVMFVGGLDAQTAGKSQDPFVVLSHRLREALQQQRRVAIWQPEKSKTFHVVFVDKDAPFPPRKLVPPDDPQYHNAHSPLSPLTPSSPLYPDGLIAPIWIRKHTTLVPSVFVFFMHIYEWSASTGRPPLETAEAEREREAEERKRDNELCAEIAQRKKSTNERGIKLTVVLLASRRMLDEPSLDTRLTHIRRQGGLDPRAALFVLSPVSPSEISDFVHSLQEALYEPALEYYTNHSKRVRRKRNRHSQGTTLYPASHPVGAMSPSARPLRPEGWSVRYEYKMACFAEFRGEDEVALKHYQDAYSSLLSMFSSTAILPPRTKRWAEAKVLADCISLKVCKLYLYNNEHSLALSHHNTHMRKFADFSRGWGIGEETFEFWSWLARQHRAFAELLEQGTRSTLKIPSHFSTTPLSNAAAAAAVQALEVGQRGVLEAEVMRALGLNPMQALQHPGFYYYMAACCTERRRRRYLDALDAEVVKLSPGFVNEQKVDHLALVLELYTRAYELFKSYSTLANQGHGRFTLWIAYLIAQTYYESGKFDMAVRFFERIAKTYRREKWDPLLQPLLSTWYSCAQQLGDMELSVRLLFEMLGHGVRTQPEDPESTQDDLAAVLKSTVPSTTEEPFTIDSSDSEPILETSVMFWEQDVSVGEAVAFQLSLTARTNVSIASLPFTTLSVHFSGDIPPVVVRHLPASDVPLVQQVDLGHISLQSGDSTAEDIGQQCTSHLRWQPGGAIILTGSVVSGEPVVMKITKVILTLQEGNWMIQIPLPQSGTRHVSQPTLPKWLMSLNPVQFMPIQKERYSSVTVHHRPHKVQVSVSHQSPAYLGEEYPIQINVTNMDDRHMELTFDALIQPMDIDAAENFISMGDERSTSLIKGVSLGIIAPGVSTSVILFLASAGAAYDRVIDISVQSRATSSAEPNSPSTPQSHTTPGVVDRDEVLRTLVIPVITPVKIEQHVVYRRSLQGHPGVADLRTYEHGFWDDADGGEAIATTTMVCMAPSGIVVEGIELARKDHQTAKVLDCSVDQDTEDFLSEWLPGDEFCDRCRISIALGDRVDEDESIHGPGEYVITWRRILPTGEHGSLSVSRFPLPELRPPTDEIIALLDVPPSVKLHVPTPLHLTIRNRHPSRSANVVVHLETDNTDGFVVAGLRSGRIPILLPGSAESLVWNLIPIECGFVRVPRIRVVDRRRDVHSAGEAVEESEGSGEPVDVVDVRLDQMIEGQGEVVRGGGAGSSGDMVVLVLP